MADFNFKTHAVVENLDGVPEQYRPLYTDGTGEHAGKKVLNPIVVPLATAYEGVNSSFGEERNKVKNLNTENAQRRQAVQAFSDLAQGLGVTVEGDTPLHEALKAFVDDLQGKVRGGQEAKINLDKVNAEWTRKMGAAVDGEKANTTKMRTALDRYLVGQAAVEALAKAGATSTNLLLPHVRSQVKVVPDGEDFVVRVVDGAGDIRMNGAGQPMSIADLVASMKSNAEFAPAFKSDAGGGSGKPAQQQQQQQRKAADAPKTSTEKIEAGLAARQKAGH